MGVINCVSSELCRVEYRALWNQSWGFQNIRKLYIEPRKPSGWEAIPLPAMPCVSSSWLVLLGGQGEQCTGLFLQPPLIKEGGKKIWDSEIFMG